MTVTTSENISGIEFTTPIFLDQQITAMQEELSYLIDRNISIIENLQQRINIDNEELLNMKYNNHCPHCGTLLDSSKAFCTDTCAEKYMYDRAGVIRLNNGKYIFGKK
jgi:hypothetical protein